MTTQQQSKIQIFKDDEINNIERDFIYKDVYMDQNLINGQYADGARIGNLNFTLQYLQSTLNEYMENRTERSLVLCPFNTTLNHPFDIRYVHNNAKLYHNKNQIIRFEPRVREFDNKYENENNVRQDQGVYNVTEKSSTVSKSRSGLFSQKSRTRTFTSK